MKRILRAAAALLCAFGLSALAQTPVTGSGAKIAGAPVTHGFINMWITNDAALPVAYTNSSGLQKPAAFPAAITGGVVASGYTVQDLCLASPVTAGVNLSYTAYLFNSDTQTGTAITGIKGVCGTSSFALDSYLNGAAASAASAVTGLLSGTTAQTPIACTGTSAYIDLTLNVIKPCINGVYVSPSGASGGSGGSAPNIVIGTVSTGPAAATLTCSNGTCTLNLTLPQGIAGQNGTSATTPTFSIGTVTTGAAGSSASVTLSGTAPLYTLNFTIPQGIQGIQGQAGSGGTGTAIKLQVNGTNTSSQTTLNLQAGAGVTITDGGSGSLSIAAPAPTSAMFASFPTTNLTDGQQIYQTDWSNYTGSGTGPCVAGTGTVRSDNAQRLCKYNLSTGKWQTADAVKAEVGTAYGIAGLDPNALLPVNQTPATAAQYVAQIKAALGNDGSLLAAWMHADAANPYKDYSGNGSDGTGGSLAPVWTRQGLYYGTAFGAGANSSFTSSAGSQPSTWSAPAVVSSNAFTYSAKLCFLSGDGIGDGSWYGVFAQSSSTSGLMLGLSGSGYSTNSPQFQAYRPSIGTGSAPSGTATDSLLPGCPVVTWTLGSGSSSLDAIYVNGTPVKYASQTYSAAARAIGTLSFGGGTTGVYVGIESSIIAVSRQVTQQEALALSGLQTRYAESNGLYETAAPGNAYDECIVGVGNSITVGDQRNGTLYPSIQLSELGSLISPIGNNVLYSSADLAVRGGNTAMNLQRLKRAGLCSPLAKRITFIIHECTNDPNVYDSNAAGTYTVCAQRTLQEARDLHALGTNVRTIVMPEWQNTSFGTTQVLAVNNYLRANCPTSGADVCLSDSDPLPFGPNAAANTTDFIDGTHPNHAGQHYKATVEAIGYKLGWNASTAKNPTAVPNNAAYQMLVTDLYTRMYYVAAGNPVVTLPNCLSLPNGTQYVFAPDSGVQAYIENATTAQVINGTDYSTGGYLMPSSKSVTFTAVESPYGAGCFWRADFPSATLEETNSAATGTLYFNFGATQSTWTLSGAVTASEGAPQSELTQCHTFKQGSTGYAVTYSGSVFVNATNVPAAANTTKTQCFKGVLSLGQWVAITPLQ